MSRGATAGGDWESSGGTGVACFKDAAAAEELDRVDRAREPIPDELVERIESLVTLEAWEQPDVEFVPGAPSEEILEKILYRLQRTGPIFFRQLQAIGPRIHYSGWLYPADARGGGFAVAEDVSAEELEKVGLALASQNADCPDWARR